ncbi:heme-binding protein [Roseibium sp. HPY-6]|uniref:SOUL family heme-binding protein n=1 Tax=Roseibium sp. HPY-6 TaxID=3229852 RepID=UPI00338DA3F7
MVKANHERSTLEQPSYEVLDTHGSYELRDYFECSAVQIKIPGGRSHATRKGFNALYSYISGNNRDRRTYAMTAPVIQQPETFSAEDTSERNAVAALPEYWLVSFFLPAATTAQTASAPNDKRVELVSLPSCRVATLSFSGRWSDRNFQGAAARLKALLKEHKITTHGAFAYAFYDAPYVLPAQRHNEVHLAVS